MKPKLENWTVVVAGAWNVRLFSPEWVGTQLLGGRPMSIEVPIGPAPALFRYSADGLNIIPSDQQLIIGVQNATLENLQKAEATAVRTLELLHHTPISGVGINLGFDEDEPGERLRDLFRISDLGPLSDFGCKVTRTSLLRSLEVQGALLNVTLTFMSDGPTEIQLNFHHPANTAETAAKLLNDRVDTCLKLGYDFLLKVYECTLEETDEQS